MIVWRNGEFVDAAGALDAGERGFLLGDGAFETIYVEHGRCAFLGAHMARLAAGLDALSIENDAGAADWDAIAAELSGRNGINGPAALRVTATRGAGGRGLLPAGGAPTVVGALTPLTETPDAVRFMISRRRRSSLSLAARFKLIGGYVDNIAALAEARAAGADDAILLNERGAVACATAANLFVIMEDGGVATPRLADGALPGVVRSLLLEGDHGVAIAEREIAAVELQRAFVFVTNSLKGLVRGAGAISARAEREFKALDAWYRSTLEDEISQ